MTEPLQPGSDPAAETSVSQVPTATHATGPLTPGQDAAPIQTPVATDPVVPPPATPARPRSRGRWVAALGVVAAVVIGSAAVGIALTSSAGQGTVTGYVPADSIAYAEVRLDLPGDQRAELAEFLSNFPGFADQAALETKLDEAIDRLLSEATDGKQTFTTDIKPWFDGEIAVASGPIAAGAEGAKPDGDGLVLISIKDGAQATAWFTRTLGEMGVTGTTETYGGTEMTVFTEPDSETASAFAIVDGKVAVAGTVDAVKAAIDTKGDSGFASDPEVAAAFAAFEDESLAFGYIGLGDIVDSAGDVLDGTAAEAALSGTVRALVPDWTAFRLRVEGDALVMDSAMPQVAEAPGPDSEHANGVPAWAPPSTIALAASNDAGATIKEALERLEADPSLKDAYTMLQEATGILGGIDGIVGWMGDTGIVITSGADLPAGGLVSIPTDPAAARQLFTTLRSFATLGGGQLGITVTDEDHAGTTVTTVDLGSLESLAGLAGSLSGETLPVEPGTIPADQHVTIAFAATDDVVVIGTDAAFVKAVLDAGPGPSLADDDRFEAAIGRVGAEHTAVSYVDVAAMRTLIESHLDEATAEERAEYEESIKPFLTPFDVFAATTVLDGDLSEAHGIVTVK